MIGRQIKLARVAKGITQSDLCKRVGITQASISQLEKGQRNPSYEVLYKLQQELDIELEENNYGLIVSREIYGLNAASFEKLIDYIKYLKWQQ